MAEEETRHELMSSHSQQAPAGTSRHQQAPASTKLTSQVPSADAKLEKPPAQDTKGLLACMKKVNTWDTCDTWDGRER